MLNKYTYMTQNFRSLFNALVKTFLFKIYIRLWFYLKMFVYELSLQTCWAFMYVSYCCWHVVCSCECIRKKRKENEKRGYFQFTNAIHFLETKHYQLMLLESIFKNIVLILYFKMDKRDICFKFCYAYSYFQQKQLEKY